MSTTTTTTQPAPGGPPRVDAACPCTKLVAAAAAGNRGHRLRRARLHLARHHAGDARAVLRGICAGRRRACYRRRDQRRQPGAAVVACRRRRSRHRRRLADLHLAGDHGPGSADLHGGVGDRARDHGDLRRDQAAQGDRQRMAADPGRRPVGDLRHRAACSSRDRRTRAHLGDRRLCHRVRRHLDSVRLPTEEAPGRARRRPAKAA